MTHGVTAGVACLFALTLAGPAAGQDQSQASRWRHERELRPAAPGPNRASVDVPLVSGGDPFRVTRREAGNGSGDVTWVARGGLKDLRFLDEAGREVPYLLVEPASTAPEWFAGTTLLPIASTKASRGFEVDLGRPAAIDRFRVEGLPAPFLKRVRLEGSGDRSRWTVLVSEASLFQLPEERMERLDLDFAPGTFRYLRLTWNDASSARLPLPRRGRARLVTRHAALTSLRVQVPFERRASEPGVSRYRLRLPGPRLPVVGIELEVDAGNVLRPARVSEGRLSDAQVIPVELGRAVLRRAVREEVVASELRVPLDQPREPEIELVIEDGDNPPLALTGVIAVFAELPWIYLESADGQPVRAVYGGRDLPAPRYDLEAARPTLDAVAMAAASWGEARTLAVPTRPEDDRALPTTGAAVDVSTFRFSRLIAAGAPGLTALKLDPAALAHGRFTDLRIATPDGRQVPYLVEKLDEPLTVPLAVLEKVTGEVPGIPPAAAGSRSIYRLRLPDSGLPAARLVLHTTARVFDRPVRVVVTPDKNGRRDSSGNTVADARWQHADPDTSAPPLTLRIPSLPASTAWVVVDEGDNSPLPLTEPTLLLPAYRLRFFREADVDLRLLYGREDLDAPRYDLALLAPRLLGASAAEVTAGPEQALPEGKRAQVSMSVFWGALVLAVVVLTILVVRLVRQ